jgi:hypothetical protein
MEVRFMKIKRFFAIIVTLCLFLTGCSKSFNWDKSVEKIENLGFVVFNSSTNEEDLNKNNDLINTDIKLMGGDFSVELDNAVALNKEVNDNYYNCMFFDFKDDEQAKSYYDLYLDTRSNENQYKLSLIKDIVVLTNSQEVIDSLGYQFK